MNEQLPIGIFDSGVGGLTIWNEINKLLPNESTLYLADSNNAPYGTKTKEEIISFSIKNVEYLINKNVKLIVVACNTATTNAIAFLRNKFPEVEIIGVEPAIKPAIEQTKTHTIGVLATQGTLESEKYLFAKKTYPNVTFIEKVGYDLVRLIETNQIYSKEMHLLLNEYIQPMIDKNIDQLVLGCTHYPLLTKVIRTIIDPSIQILDSGAAVAKRVQNILTEQKLHNSQNIAEKLFYSNSDIQVLKSLLPKARASCCFKKIF